MIGEVLRMEIRGLEPCPRNRSHTLTTRKQGKFSIPMNIKTEAARAYEEAVHQELQKFGLLVDDFYSKFDPEKHALHAIWNFGSPDVKTQKGAVSRNSVDLDAHKVLQDTVMKFVGIDDAYIVKDTRTKVYSPEHFVEIELWISKIPDRTT